MNVAASGLLNLHQLEQDYNARKSQYEKAEEALRSGLEVTTKRLKALGIVVSHPKTNIKTFDSFARKVVQDRKERDPFSLGDLVRGRLVLLNLQDLALTARFLKNSLWRPGKPAGITWQSGTEKDRYADKLARGYRGLHVQVKLQSLPELSCEIQLRTLLDDAWAEWEHLTRYKAADASFSQVENDFVEAMASDFDRLRDRADNLRSTVSQRVARSRADSAMGKFATVDNLPDESRLMGSINAVARETDLLFVSNQGCPTVNVRATLSGARFGIQPGPLEADCAQFVENLFRGNVESSVRALLGLSHEYLTQCHAKAQAREIQFENNLCAGLVGWKAVSQGPSEILSNMLTLMLARTSYYAHCSTNRALWNDPAVQEDADVARSLQTLHMFLAEHSRAFQDKVLANALSIHVVLIGRKDGLLQALVTRRAHHRDTNGPKLAETAGQWNSSASGYVFPQRSQILIPGDVPGYEFQEPARPSGAEEDIPVDLFLAAQRELWEELAVYVSTHQLRLVGLCNVAGSRHPHLIFEAFANDDLHRYEGTLGDAVERWEVESHKIIDLTRDCFQESLLGQAVPALLGPNKKGATWTAVGRLSVLLSFLRHVDGAWSDFQRWIESSGRGQEGSPVEQRT